MKLSILLLIALATLSNAQSFDLDIDSLYNDFYECEFGNGEVMKIHLQHLRITRATVSAFGQTFSGLGSFYDGIVVTDKSAQGEEPATLHISKDGYFGLPYFVSVHTRESRAPQSYALVCQNLY
jgi:hypothetical protein